MKHVVRNVAPVALGFIALAALYRPALASSAGSTDIPIEAGPAAISPAEAAIAADPAHGMQHGVILIDETERDDTHGSMSERGRHVRAKILSPEGRGLADIAIPVEHGSSSLKKWWGRTILPDGKVLELREDELKAQQVAKFSGMRLEELRGALPGVVPGCIIDYGYVVRTEGFESTSRIALQADWPIRMLRYRWVPSHELSAAYVLSRADALGVTAKSDGRSVLLIGHDLETVPDEPLMPPMHEARASATFYYTNRDKPQEYWDLGAKRVDTRLKSFLSGGAIHEAVASAGVSESAPLQDKLKQAYDWLVANVKNTNLRSAEEMEARNPDPKDDAYNAKTVLKVKEASPYQLACFYAGMARALGADADLVYAVDRTDRFWNPSLKSFDQFTYAFVGVRAPGAPDDAITLVDPGSGLPYGELPWRAAGANALRCTAKGSASISVPPSSPTSNRTDVHGALSFSDDNESILAKWSRKSVGARGLGERRVLRDKDGRERKELLDRLCGASGKTEVTTANVPSLDDLRAPFQLDCDVEMSSTPIDDRIARYALSFDGPWWSSIPEFTSETRTHPIIFDYPELVIISLDVTAPKGFKPKDPPPAVNLDSPYGRYQLVVTKTATGFHVDRAFALTVLIAKPPEYAAVKKYFTDVHQAEQVALDFERERSAP